MRIYRIDAFVRIDSHGETVSVSRMNGTPLTILEPESMTGTLLTHWTIRIALLLYVLVLSGELVAGNKFARSARLRWLWTAGCLAFLFHVGCAFHFYHGWSHARAFAETARQTRELIGWEFGAGIFGSYFFTALWMADTAWWWLSPLRYADRPRALHWMIHAFMTFIAINGAMVFESGVTRWGGLLACGWVSGLLIQRLRGKLDEGSADAFSPGLAHRRD